MVGEVAQWMAEGREFPIEHRDHTRLGRMHDHIVHAEITMHERGFVWARNIRGQPGVQPIHVGDFFGF